MCLILRMLATNRIVDVTITLKPSWLRRAHNAPYRFSFAVKEHSIRQSSTDSVTYIRMYRSIRFDILWCGRLVYRLDKLTLDKIYLNDRKSLMLQCLSRIFYLYNAIFARISRHSDVVPNQNDKETVWWSWVGPEVKKPRLFHVGLFEPQSRRVLSASLCTVEVEPIIRSSLKYI